VVLRPARPHPRTTLDDVIGCIPYDEPPVPVEEMDAGVDAAAREMWDAFERQGRDAS
jgi:hypothetical protein